MPNFPLPAETLLPHEGLMCCLDTLLFAQDNSAEAEVVLNPGHALLHNGELHPAGFIELAAQTAGTLQGWNALRNNEAPGAGFLVGAQDFHFHVSAHQGDCLRIRIEKIAELEDVNLFTTQIFRAEELLAEGRIKVFSHAV